jgi:para-aminobenzoate synthetase component I
MSEAIVYSCQVNAKLLGKLYKWAESRFTYCCLMQDNEIAYPSGGFPNRLYAGSVSFGIREKKNFKGHETIIALIAYDYKNNIERLQSNNPELISTPESLFFPAELTVEIKRDHLIFFHPAATALISEFLGFQFNEISNPEVSIKALTTQNEYISAVSAIQSHIVEGDIYELNYCIGFEFDQKEWDPVQGYLDLMAVSPMPFSALYKADQQYLICASPERFLKKSGDKLLAQPIKGTSRRGANAKEDKQLKSALLHSEKERAENLMIVDLMRNDLARISYPGSVTVPELFGVYPFKNIFQMISSVESQQKEATSYKEILHATFPMGSMTGAPKIKCMELIEQYENFRRGWFSGTLGYINSNGDFDFNVIIRSIIFDSKSGKGYFAVGSAITCDADPKMEYEECLLKASAIFKVLQKS